MKLTSPTFADGGPIPRTYTCDGEGQSPPLAWSDVPAGTADLVLVVEDPDAPNGGFVHWVVPYIPPSTTSLPAAGKPGPAVAGLVQGKNGAGGEGWQPLCPPPGADRHHYVFTLYALRHRLAAGPNVTAADLRRAMRPVLLGQVRLTGTYQRA